jgi:glycosyltransferase involved in cell wall biosynthesis
VEILILYLGTKGAGPALTYSFASECIESNHNITIVYSKKNELKTKYLKLKAKLVDLEISNTILGLLNILRIVKSIIKIIKLSRSSDVIFIPMFHPITVLILPIFKLFNKETISCIHDAKPHEGDNIKIIKFANKIIIKNSERIIAFSRNQANYLHQNYKCKNLYILRHPSFSHYTFSNLENRHNQLIFFGRLEKYKGLDLLIETAKLIHDRLGIKTKVYGKISDAGILNMLSNSSSLQLYQGYLPDNELQKLLESTVTLILPYTSATQSGVLVLGYDAGCKIIATPVEGIIEQAQQLENVYLSKSMDPEDLYNAYTLALNSQKKANVKIDSGLSRLLIEPKHFYYKANA